MKEIAFEVSERVGSVSGLVLRPRGAVCGYVLAHGAGAGMNHAFMAGFSEALAREGVATLRYQFPYTEQGRKRPDYPTVLQATVRAAVRQARTRLRGLPLLAGGKSMGGRMTSQAQSREPLDGVAGLVFAGFPLHAPGRDGVERAEHLNEVSVPMLFLQGSRDKLARLDLIREVAERVHGTMHVIEDADHSFKVPKRTGRTTDEVIDELARTVRAFWDGLS